MSVAIRAASSLSLTLLMILSAAGAAEYTVGDWTIARLTDNDYNDQNPEVSGTNVTWMANLGGWEIMALLDGEIVQVTDTGLGSFQPQISGSNIVWSGYATSNQEIYLYDGETTSRLTWNSVSDQLPHISGSRVGWHAYNGQDRDVFMWFDGVITQLTDNTESDDPPWIWGSSVVWSGLSPREIFFYDGMSVHQLTSTGMSDQPPRVYGNAGDDDFSVVWSGYDGDTFEIYRYDGTTIEKLTDSVYGRDNPEVHGDRIVYQGWLEDGRQHAFLHDESGSRMISPDTQMVFNPKVSESIVAWWANTSELDMGEIFVYEEGVVTQLTDNDWPDLNVAVSGNTIVWEGRPVGHAYEIYMATKSTISALDPIEGSEAPDVVLSTTIRAAPNPFNPVTTIRFDLETAGHARLTIHDVDGKLVRTLVDEYTKACRREVSWNGRDDVGRRVASGVYICNLEAGDRIVSRRVTLLK